MYFNAISLYRLGKLLTRLRIPLLPRAMEVFIFVLFNSHIPLSAEIGKGTYCGHRGIGVVISERSRIGRNVLIRAHVVIGGGGSKRGRVVIEDNVEIGAGAKILGGVTVGSGAKIGANAVVIDDVPPGTTAVGVPARIKKRTHV